MTDRKIRNAAPVADPVRDDRFRVGPRWLGLYRNGNDTRLFVPKPGRRFGRTLNLAHPHARWLIASFVFLLLIGIGLDLASR